MHAKNLRSTGAAALPPVGDSLARVELKYLVAVATAQK